MGGPKVLNPKGAASYKEKYEKIPSGRWKISRNEVN